MVKSHACQQCGEPATRMYCTTTCGNKWRYQNDPVSREKSKAAASAYRDKNRDQFNAYFRLKRSTTVQRVLEDIYWCEKRGDQDMCVDLAHDIMDMALGCYSTDAIEHFVMEYLDVE